MCKTYIGSLLTLKFVVHLALSPLGRTGRVWANCSFRKTALANGLFSIVKLSGTLILLKYMYYHTISLTCQSYEANVPFCPQSVLPVLPLHLLVWNKLKSSVVTIHDFGASNTRWPRRVLWIPTQTLLTCYMDNNPANTRHPPNAVSMLAQRL